MSGPSYSLKDLADKVNGKLVGDPDLLITTIATIQNASPGSISFISNPRYKKFLDESNASAIIIKQELSHNLQCSGIVVDDPYIAYATISSLFRGLEDPYNTEQKLSLIHI